MHACVQYAPHLQLHSFNPFNSTIEGHKKGLISALTIQKWFLKVYMLWYFVAKSEGSFDKVTTSFLMAFRFVVVFKYTSSFNHFPNDFGSKSSR